MIVSGGRRTHAAGTVADPPTCNLPIYFFVESLALIAKVPTEFPADDRAFAPA